MRKLTITTPLILLTFFTVLPFLISNHAYAQEKEVLTLLTKEERELNARDVVLNQPDFSADLTFFVGEGFGGYGGAERRVRKGASGRSTCDCKG